MLVSDCFRYQKELKEEKQRSVELLAAEKQEHASAVQKMQVSAVLKPCRVLSLLMRAMSLYLTAAHLLQHRTAVLKLHQDLHCLFAPQLMRHLL